MPSNSPTSDDDDIKERSSSCIGVYDASGEIKQLCKAMALKDVSKSSIAIANKVAEKMGAKYKHLGEKNDIFTYISLLFLVGMPYRYLETSKL